MLHALQPTIERAHGEGWQKWETERRHRALLEHHGRLSKVRRLLHRRGVVVPYSTLHRFAVAELGFGQRSPTIPVSDGKPGEEIHIDTGWMTLLEPDEHGQRPRFRAWIFMPHLSRHRFVYPFVYPCFAGEELLGLDGARARGRRGSTEEYGMRRHTTTQRLPRDVEPSRRPRSSRRRRAV